MRKSLFLWSVLSSEHFFIDCREILCEIFSARMSNIIETEKKKSEMLKDVIEHGRSLTEETLFQQERAKDLSKDYVQHSICQLFL